MIDHNDKKQKIIEFMQSEDYQPMKREELAFVLSVPKEEMEHFYKVIDELKQDVDILEIKRKKLIPLSATSFKKGMIRTHQNGFGFVKDTSTEVEYFTPSKYMNHAFDQDIVLFEPSENYYKGKNKEAKIIQVITRNKTKFVGLFVEHKYFGHVIPDDKRFYQDIYISKKNVNRAKNNQKVLVEIIKFEGKNPEGKIIDILGHQNDDFIDVISVLKNYDIETQFPTEVMNEVNNFYVDLKSEFSKREDLRNDYCFTIDGSDAKDMDDAVSLRLNNHGNYLLSVHIADVSHFVKQNSALDQEAFHRSVSLYFLDTVIPMLPEKLSNDLCSLKPFVDRLCLSVIMEIDKNGKLLHVDIKKSIIQSKYKLTYEDVALWLTHGCEDEKLLNSLRLMKNLSEKLRQKRFERGSIDFDMPESKIILDSHGRAVDVVIREKNEATQLIEEFMIITNEAIAQTFFWQQIPLLYRNHEKPDQEKIHFLNTFIHNFKLSIKGNKENIHPKQISDLLYKIKEKDFFSVVNRIVLRSMKQARYNNKKAEHFALSADFYTHFTAPIRRYPDLINHRIISNYLEQKNSQLKNLEEIASICTMKEKRAEEVEREINKMKKAQYMESKIMEEYEGIISSVTHFGLYVELPNTVEGMVSLKNMDDHYVFDEQKLCLIGKNKQYRLGQTVKIRVTASNAASGEIDFLLLS